MDSKLNNNILYVRTFGSFSMTYNGNSILGGAKSSESQFAGLMQLLLHFREEGVSRDQIERVLFADRELNNIHHATRSVIYNAKKKLKEAGFPEVNYIERKKDIYFWTKEIPIIEDASEFERLYLQAETENLIVPESVKLTC